ncbi:30193_t:CDS:2, partial [Racocetra persica]
YTNLFEKCWSAEPDQRLSLDQVLVELNKLSTETTVEFIINSIYSDDENIHAKPNTSTDSEIFPEEIKTFDYKEFSEHRKIGKGRFGIVYEAKWKGEGLM